MLCWFGNIHDYNSGRNVGDWINIEDFSYLTSYLDAIDDLEEKVKEVTKHREGAEEWWIQDFEPDFSPFLGECSSLRSVLVTQEIIDELWNRGFKDESDAVSIIFYVDERVSTCIESETKEYYDAFFSFFDDSYAGEYKSKEDWAEDFLHQTGQLSELSDQLKYYFDYESFAEAQECDGITFLNLECGNVLVLHSW